MAEHEFVDCPICGLSGCYVTYIGPDGSDFECQKCGKLTTRAITQEQLDADKRWAKREARDRLRGTFTPSTVEKNRKHRRAETAANRRMVDRNL